MLRVGLTGGIACGKSHVLARLAAAGCHTLDLDGVAHELMAPGNATYEAVVAAFGPAILAPGGAIDRKALGARVFADAGVRARLNAIVHPAVRAEEARRVAAWAGDPGAIAVIDAALLVESGVHLRFDRLVVVHCSPEDQVRRLMQRDGLERRAAEARVASQMPAAEKRAFAHFALDSSGLPEGTRRAADALAGDLKRLASARPAARRARREQVLGCLACGPADGPAGVSPARLLEEISSARGLEMRRAAALLGLTGEAWYEGGRELDAGAAAAGFAFPLAMWCLARAGPDPEFLAAAAGSLSRMTIASQEQRADVCWLALAALDALATGGLSQPPALGGARALAERWGGDQPSRLPEAVFELARRHESDPARARSAQPGPAGELAAGLAGLARGVWEDAAPAWALRAASAFEAVLEW